MAGGLADNEHSCLPPLSDCNPRGKIYVDYLRNGFTYANAIHQALKRIGADTAQIVGIEAARGVLHGAMAVYLARYLNVPPARLPGEDGDRLDDLADDVAGLRKALLEAFDRQRQVDAAGRLVARLLMLGHPPNALIAALAEGLLREDAGFHAYQMLEAGVRQFGNGATPMRAGTFLLAWRVTLQRIRPLSVRRFRRPTSRSDSCEAASCIRMRDACSGGLAPSVGRLR